MALWQIAVLLNPTEKEKEDGKMEEILVMPCWIVAKDKAHAERRAIRMAPAELEEEKDTRMEVLARPFG